MSEVLLLRNMQVEAKRVELSWDGGGEDSKKVVRFPV